MIYRNLIVGCIRMRNTGFMRKSRITIFILSFLDAGFCFQANAIQFCLHKVDYGGATRSRTIRVRIKSSRLMSMPVPGSSVRHW